MQGRSDTDPHDFETGGVLPSQDVVQPAAEIVELMPDYVIPDRSRLPSTNTEGLVADLVPSDRSETDVAATSTESGLAFTASELRDRYDGSYRKEMAEMAWKRRGEIVEEREMTAFGDEVEERDLEAIRLGNQMKLSNTIRPLQRKIDYVRTEANGGEGLLQVKINNKKREIENRGRLEKMVAFTKKYLPFLGEDQIVSQLNDLEAEKLSLVSHVEDEIAKLRAEIEAYTVVADQERAERESAVRQKYAGLREAESSEKEEVFAVQRKSLRNNVREINSRSRIAAERTAELLAEGSLDVSKLAVETNSVVIHAIPYPGYLKHHRELVGESYLNKSIDTKAASTEDKIRIVAEESPDLAVSIVSLGGEGLRQSTTYPFGLVVDGKIIASYSRDVSTVADGDRRSRTDTQTLQEDPVSAFTKNAAGDAEYYGWNEAILHQPDVKGVFIDMREGWGILYEGGADGLVAYARKQYPDLPIFIRQDDGFYDETGNRVTAEQIYGTNHSENDSESLTATS